MNLRQITANERVIVYTQTPLGFILIVTSSLEAAVEHAITIEDKLVVVPENATHDSVELCQLVCDQIESGLYISLKSDGGSHGNYQRES